MDRNEIYKDYDNYDWDTFQEFQQGLKEILDDYLENLQQQDTSVSAIPISDQQQLIKQAKSFFYCHKTGNIINLDDYESWKRNQSKHDEATVNTDNEDPPYSSNYQELVELIVSGKPVPGIKQIPDTVLTDQKSISTKQQRPKPWES